MLELVLVEIQLIAGIALIALVLLAVFRSKGLSATSVSSSVKNGWRVALVPVACNVAGIWVGTLSNVATVQPTAEAVEAATVSLLFALPVLVDRRFDSILPLPHATRFQQWSSRALVLVLGVRALLAPAEWSFAMILASLAFSAVAAAHVCGISWASMHLKAKSDYLAGAASMRSRSSSLVLFGLCSALLAAVLLPFVLLAQHYGHALDTWNTLAPVFLKGSEIVTPYAAIIDQQAFVNAILRLCGSAIFFLLAEEIGSREAYVAFTALTSLRRIVEGPYGFFSVLVQLQSVATTLTYLYAVRGSAALSVPRQNGLTVLNEVDAYLSEIGEDNGHDKEEEDGLLHKKTVTHSFSNAGSEPERAVTRIASVLILLLLCIDASIGIYLNPRSVNWAKIDTRGNTKWIVVTTVSLPTSTMDALCALPDWEVAVVADKKTPKHWQSGHCHFLSVKDQMRLPFQIVRHIPFKAYTRKNIGYLYAIANGATTVFDTDDDNLPTEEIVLEDPDSKSPLFGYRTDMRDRETVNIYSHFGRPDIWPRGYPLDHIDSRESLDYLESSNVPASLDGRALVQQGLADLDPDVDAIFRLLHPQDITTVKFCRDAPTLKLARGILSPFNSQNTFWHRDAFWGLLLPITVTFRVTDIMRGYWVQRILWDIGGLLSFRRPSVDQIRNVHDYLIDFESELQLYHEAGNIAEFLHLWQSDKEDVAGRIEHLFADMVTAGFIKRGDQQLMKAWLADLQLVGYEFPALNLWDRERAVTDADLSAKSPAPSGFADQIDWLSFKCQLTEPKPVFKDTLLVVIYNEPLYQGITAYEDLYKQYFPNIVYYGPHCNAGDDRVTELDLGGDTPCHGGGQLGYRALLHAVRNHPGYQRYIYADDDVALNPYAFWTLNADRFWMSKSFYKGFDELEIGQDPTEDMLWFAWKRKDIKDDWFEVFDALPDVYKNRLIESSKTKKPTIYGGQSDFFHLPGRLAVEFADLLECFSEKEVFLEVVTRSVTRMFPAEETEENIPELSSYWLWDDNRQRAGELLTPRAYVGHPYKMSNPDTVATMKRWLIRCAEYWQIT